MRAPALRRAVRPWVITPRRQLRHQHINPDKPLSSLLNGPEIVQTPSDIAFCFDIDGVLLRSATPIPGAIEALRTLQARRIPFILLTNGGGKHESERVADLSKKLSVPLDTSLFVQSHTPFSRMGDKQDLKHKCVLVVGGDGAKCREVAEAYGYANVVTPGDIYAAHPEIWPFSRHFKDYYRSFARPLLKPVDPASPENSLKIDAVFVYNDPRDWGLDIQLLIDVMLSRQGILGTSSPKNGDTSLPNHGFLQDGQPHLYFSNPDLLWAANYPLSRLGQGAFRRALFEVWRQVQASYTSRNELLPLSNDHYTVIGKPCSLTYEFAEEQLMRHRQSLLGEGAPPLKTVYMVGDNPDSDIEGANSHQSPSGVKWVSVLVRTGVFNDAMATNTRNRPKHIVQDVAEAVALGLTQKRAQHGAHESTPEADQTRSRGPAYMKISGAILCIGAGWAMKDSIDYTRQNRAGEGHD